MHPWAPVSFILLSILLLTSSLQAQLVQLQPQQLTAPTASATPNQNSKAEQEKAAAVRRQSALTLLELVLSGSKNLSLPQNRIAIATDAFPLLWTRNEPQARALVTQMIGDFAQASGDQQEHTEPNALQMLHQRWQVALRIIAQFDAELALSFMNATRTYVQVGDPDQQAQEERSLRLEFATQQAARNPRNALRLAEKELQTPGDLPMELIGLLATINASDPEAGAQLFHEMVSRARGADLSNGEGNFSFALNLLNSQANNLREGSAPDESLKNLAESVASAALSPDFPATSLPILQGSIETLQQLVPGRAQALSQKADQYSLTLNPQQQAWNQFSQAQASGDPNQLLAVAEQASPEFRPNMMQQAAWQFANNGDLQRVRQVADKLSDPFQREQVIQQAIRQSAWNALNQGEFAAARQLAQEITPDEERATTLAQFATNAVNAKQQTVAEEMLEEASGLLASRTPGLSVFTAQLQVAQAFAHVKPSRAVPLLERSAGQLQQVLAAAVEVDAFLPYQHSFEAGELILNNSFICNSLIQPYADATATLAYYDFPSARILADRLPLPEVRLFAELAVARNALNEQDTPPPVQGIAYGGTVGFR